MKKNTIELDKNHAICVFDDEQGTWIPVDAEVEIKPTFAATVKEKSAKAGGWIKRHWKGVALGAAAAAAGLVALALKKDDEGEADIYLIDDGTGNLTPIDAETYLIESTSDCSEAE